MRPPSFPAFFRPYPRIRSPPHRELTFVSPQSRTELQFVSQVHFSGILPCAYTIGSSGNPRISISIRQASTRIQPLKSTFFQKYPHSGR